MLGTIAQGIMKWQATRDMPVACRSDVLAICSRKGGVGKTTTAVHVAVAAARFHSKRVLIVDMDPQGHVRRALSSVLRRERVRTLSSVLMDRKGDVLDASLPTDWPNLWVVPADTELEQVQLLLATRIGREFVLNSALSRAREVFDLIVIDCPPNLDTLTINALVASRFAVAPTDLSLLGMEGVSGIYGAIQTIRERLGLPVELIGIALSRVDGRNRTLNTELVRMLKAQYGDLVMDETIPSNVAVGKACLAGMPVFAFDPSAAAASGFKKLSHDILGRLEP